MIQFLLRCGVSIFLLTLGGFVGHSAHAECRFDFETALVETTSEQNLAITTGNKIVSIRGNWFPTRQLAQTDRLREFSKPIGRLDICLQFASGEFYTTHCTANLLAGNRILTARHCTDIDIISKSFGRKVERIVALRLLMGYESVSNIDDAAYYAVNVGEGQLQVGDLDAQILKVDGDPNARWGRVDIVPAKAISPGERLIVVHHPYGITKQFNPVGCSLHGGKAPIGQIAHICETLGGSSGALLAREDDLSLVGLHVAGGKRPGEPESFNRAIPIGIVIKKLGLPVTEPKRVQLCKEGATEISAQTELPKALVNSLKRLYAECPNVLSLIDALLVSGAVDEQSVPGADATKIVNKDIVKKPKLIKSATPEVLAAIEACDKALSSEGKLTARGLVISVRGTMPPGENALPWNELVPVECVKAARSAPQNPRAARLYGLAVWHYEGPRANEGRYWLRLAAANDDTIAKGQLGLMLLRGNGGNKNESGGLALLKEASDDGDGLASTILGNHFHKTDGATARRYFERGSFQGATGSEFFLAMHYLDKEPEYKLDERESNLDLAIQYLERAKAGGNGFAYLESAMINISVKGSDLLLIKSGYSSPRDATSAERAFAVQQAAKNAANDIYGFIENTGALAFTLALRPETVRDANWQDFSWAAQGFGPIEEKVYVCQDSDDSFGNDLECPANEFDSDREKLRFFWSELQTLLQKDGFYKGKIDGDFGAGSRAALRRSHQAKQQQYQHRSGVDPTTLAYEDSPIVAECLRLSSGPITDDVNTYRACAISSDRYPDQSRVAMGMGDALAAMALNAAMETKQRVWALNSARQAYQNGLRLNHPRAAVELALLPETPDSKPRSVSDLNSNQRTWLRQAANNGSGRAMLLLAEASDTGAGYPRDTLIAAQLIVSALEAGEPRAIDLLASVSIETRAEVQKLMKKREAYSGPLDGQIDTSFLNASHELCSC